MSPEAPEYPFHDRTIQVTQCRRICIGRRKFNLTTVFAGKYVVVGEVVFGDALTGAGSRRTSESKQTYQEFVHPTFIDFFDYWRNGLEKKILFHVCGDWSDRFDLLIEERPDILHVDQIDLTWLKKLSYPKVTINGNVSTTKTLLTGTPEEVERESLRCIESAAPGGGFLLGADCTLGNDTPAENVRAMTKAVRRYGTYPIGK